MIGNDTWLTWFDSSFGFKIEATKGGYHTYQSSFNDLKWFSRWADYRRGLVIEGGQRGSTWIFAKRTGKRRLNFFFFLVLIKNIWRACYEGTDYPAKWYLHFAVTLFIGVAPPVKVRVRWVAAVCGPDVDAKSLKRSARDKTLESSFIRFH